MPDPSSRPTALRLAARVASGLLLLAAVAVLAALVVLPRVAGATPYTILTGSMRPQMPPGTLVVTRPVDPGTIEVGDVVTYQLRSGRSAVVTHRVVGVAVDGDGERTFVTRGDANDVADAKPVQAVQVRGQVWYHVPVLGRLNTMITGQQHVWMLVVVVAGLLLYSAYQLTGAAIDRRRRRHRHVAGAEPTQVRS